MEDHEDRLITEINFFITLRKTFPTNSKSDSKRTHVEECIKNGADINTRFANDSNNTPLHIAVMKGESEIVDLLLRYGAQVNIVNDAGKTALDLAKKLPGRSYIVELITAHEERLKVGCGIHQSGQTNESATTIHEYKKRPGTANVRGQLYETKLLTMIYFRALRCKEITQFYLASNVDEVGDMDDVCLRFKTENGDYIVFLQAKYKHDVVKGKIRYHDLWQPTNDFSLLKCYDSYMNVRQKFNVNSADDFFRGKYEDIKPYFVMYTTIKEDIKDISKVQPIVDDVVDYLIGTGKRQHIFQFTSEEKNIELIINMLLKGQMRNMGKRFVQFLREKKYDLMLTDDNIKCFHVVLARKVIEVNDVIENGYRTGTFRDEFFSTNDQLLIELRETLFAEVDEKINMNKDEIDLLIQKILREPTTENISKLIGSILMYNSKNNSLKLINEGTSWFPTYQKRLASLQIPESVVNQAIVLAGRRKLQSLQLKFPIGFGNLDMTINENKRASRLDHLATKICELIKNSSDKQNVVIREGVFSSVKKQESKLLDINGGIGGAVGNLLISDGENKLKFNLDDGSMKENARGLLERLTTALGDLQIYRFLIDIDYCAGRSELYRE